MKLTRSLATLRDGWGNPKLKAIQLYTHDLIEMQVDELETKKVYVASGWKYRNLVKNIYYPKIEEAGIEITHKWMMDEDGIQTAENYRRAAQRCVKGVQDADAVICVLPSDDYPYRGTNFELGVAHAMGIPVVVYDPCDKARNVMLTQAPELVTPSLDKVITATFDIIARKCATS